MKLTVAHLLPAICTPPATYTLVEVPHLKPLSQPASPSAVCLLAGSKSTEPESHRHVLGVPPATRNLHAARLACTKDPPTPCRACRFQSSPGPDPCSGTAGRGHGGLESMPEYTADTICPVSGKLPTHVESRAESSIGACLLNPGRVRPCPRVWNPPEPWLL